MSPFAQRLSRRWYVLRGSRPGERFQKVLQSRCQDRGFEWLAIRQRILTAAVLLVLIAVLMAPSSPILAGPILALAVGLVARESYGVAQWLDRADHQLEDWRRRRCIQRWRDRSGPPLAVPAIIRPMLAGFAFASATLIVLLVARG